jgi:hypothetical protein
LGLTLWVSNPSSERLATELLDQADIQHAPWYEHLALISAPKAAQPANQCYAVFIHPHDVRGFVRLLGFARFLAANHQGSRLIVLGTTPDDIALMRTGCVWVTGMLEEADVKFSARLFRCALSVVIEDQIDPEQVALHHSQLTRLNTKVFQRQSTDRGANDPHYLDIEAPYQRWVSHLQGEPYAA